MCKEERIDGDLFFPPPWKRVVLVMMLLKIIPGFVSGGEVNER